MPLARPFSRAIRRPSGNPVSGNSASGNSASGSPVSGGLRRQLGMGALGFIFVLLVIGGTAALVIKLVPHYLSFYSIVDALQQLDERSLTKPKFKLYDDIKKKVFKINNIHDVEPQDWIGIEKQRNKLIFHVDYRVEEPIIQQVGVYVHFQRDIVRTL